MRTAWVGFVAFLFFGCSKNDIVTFDKLTLANVGINSAIVNVTLSKAAKDESIEFGFCWSRNPLPTKSRDQFAILKKEITKQISDTIKGLGFNTFYYARAFLKTSNGIRYSDQITFKTLESPYKIGQTVGNGFVFHIDSTGLHGMIASKTIGHCTWTAWWDGFKYKYIGTSIKFGKGFDNTKKIIAAGLNSPNTAAIFCDNFTQDGVDEWFLPSYEELIVLKNNLGGNFYTAQIYPGDIYWSSSEVSPNMSSDVWFCTMNAIASFFYDSKDSDHGIIPVRYF